MACLIMPTETELRTEFERQHQYRNLTSHHLRGTYLAPQIAALWNQHVRTARWVFALIELAEDKPELVNPAASVESLLRGLIDAIEQGTDCMTNQVDRARLDPLIDEAFAILACATAGQAGCERCGYPAGADWLDGGETCPKCKLVQ